MKEKTQGSERQIDFGVILARINENTLRTLDNYMQDVADGETQLQTPVLRAVIDLLKMNKEVLEERRTEADRLSSIETMISEMPDFTHCTD
ncbi:hypothetical protein RZ532_08465 [Nitratireductor aquimarinus]|uniref:hypothetical protein n=1 Tax=Nitratireductor aquimarinus TaxID=889300 RepID=UPI0029369BA7|nr:hypothetical protein [Nitratireductor aquimarinus]MDV2966005.1 hypothetical protein [Nitratireductor aquimarinus]